jgi:putative endonuclease
MSVELRRSWTAFELSCEVELRFKLLNMETYIVYIVLCNDGSYYVGCTNNLADRLKRHAAGQVAYTKSRLPIQLITSIQFSDKYMAFDFEKYLKTGSGRAFMYKRFVKKIK